MIRPRPVVIGLLVAVACTLLGDGPIQVVIASVCLTVAITLATWVKQQGDRS
jgi:hypothetical protein